MRLKNGKSIENHIEIINKCCLKLPIEILKIIASYHHCERCIKKKEKHCYNCNVCNIYKNFHFTCKICDKCYPKYQNVKYSDNLTFNNVIIHHIHCEKCNKVKKYSFRYFYYYCDYCEK